jgi:hypothetical protein
LVRVPQKWIICHNIESKGGAPASLARKIAAAKKEAAKARAGKNSFPPTPFLFARPSVPFWFCRAKRGYQLGFCSK